MDEEKIEAMFEKHSKTFTGAGDYCFDYLTLNGFKVAVRQLIANKENREWREECAKHPDCNCGDTCMYYIKP